MGKIIDKVLSVFRKPSTMDAVVPTINIVDRSTLLNDADFQQMVEACKVQMEQHVAPMWLRGPWKIVVNQPEDVGYPIVIVDDPDHAGALGYHTQSPGGKVWGRVFVKPVIKAGGTMLHGSMSVSAVLSHEVIEAYCDPNVNLWANTGAGQLVCYEACDPVERDTYEVTTKSGNKVSVSNFVLPAWFDPLSDPNSKFDWLALLTKPFDLSKGGYAVVMDIKTGKVQNVFGSLDAEVHHAVRQDPHPASRSARKTARSSD